MGMLDSGKEQKMSIQFLENCKCILDSEKQDYSLVLRTFEKESEPFVAFLPAVTADLWPVYVLECTEARQYRIHGGKSVYIVPIDTHNSGAISCFGKLINDFYMENATNDSKNYYGASLEEMILLHSPDISNSKFLNRFSECNVIYLRISFEMDRNVDLVFLLEKPEVCWKGVIEKYNIATDYIIDSHKGMGNWFEYTKLYELVIHSHNSSILPKYYFKGKYISHDAPKDYQLVYRVPESKKGECISEIYRTNYHNEIEG